MGKRAETDRYCLPPLSHSFTLDWVAIWNGRRPRAEAIKAEITAFLAESLKLRLADDKTLITHIDEGFDFVGYRLKGDKRGSDGKWCLFSRVPPKAIQRFREAVKAITPTRPSRMKSRP